MKHFLLTATCFLNLACLAVTHDVEVGGGGANGTPYYDPQELTIAVGDVVNWTWVSGQHNVTSTAGPTSFMSGNLSAPNEWAFTFDVAGVYEYECTLFNHAATQFGTITVGPNNLNEQKASAPNFEVYPNPAHDLITIDKNNAFNSEIRLYDMTGKIVHVERANAQLRTRIGVGSLTRGIYFVEMSSNGRTIRRRLIIE